MYEIFAQLLQNHGITAYKVAKDVGIAQTTLSDWKRGRSIPKTEKMQKIADYFNVPLDYLLGNTDEKKPSSVSGKELDEQLDGIEFALYGEVKELSDAAKQDVLNFIRFKKSLEEKEKKGE